MTIPILIGYTVAFKLWWLCKHTFEILKSQHIMIVMGLRKGY